ncbi:MAG: RNA polymerase sigma factor [Elusimicrobia bacterium]|nr:RNA polymerase sigma factor [Elusimicrobiota bacterium]
MDNNQNHVEENNLVKKAKSGDVNAFEKLISIHQERIYNFAYYLTGNEPDARDLSQDVLIKIFCSINNFEEKSRFSTWVWRIIHNTFLDECKSSYKKNLSQSISLESILHVKDERDCPEKEVEKSQFSENVEQTLLKIPVKYRITVVMYDIQGFSYDEIAEISKSSIGTIKSRLNRGRKLLSKMIMKSGTFF